MRPDLRVALALVCAVGLAGCGAQAGGSAAGMSLAPSAPADGSSPAAAGRDGDAIGGLPCPATDPAAAPVANGLPEVSLPCLAGGPEVDLAKVRGVPMVLNVWASWCAPCREEMPLLADVAADAGSALRVLGISVLDDRDAAAGVATQVPLASVYDRTGATRASLGWTGPPATYYVDASGAVVGRRVGQIPDAAALRADVAQYLGVELP